jgi:glutathione S-transferase
MLDSGGTGALVDLRGGNYPMPTVLGVGLSPFVRKVRVALAEKGIPYDLLPVFPQATDEEFRKLSPTGKIPAFRDGDKGFADSSVISLYLEKTHPAPSLYPSDPFEYARALWFEEYADSAMVGVIGPKIFFEKIVAPRFFNREPNLESVEKAVKEDLPPLFEYLESQLTGEYLAGNQLSIGDIAVCSMLVNLFHAGYGIDTQKFPKLARYVARIHERPSFRNCIDEEKATLGG